MVAAIDCALDAVVVGVFAADDTITSLGIVHGCSALRNGRLCYRVDDMESGGAVVGARLAGMVV